MHDADRRQDRLRLHDTVARRHHDDCTAAEEGAGARPRHRDRAARRKAAWQTRATALDVEPQEVIPGEAESADWCLRFYAAVRPVPIVAVKPSWQLGGAFF